MVENEKKDKEQFSEETVIDNGKKAKDEKFTCYLAMDDGTRIPITCSSFTIGRSQDCNLPLNDIKVSRIHCRITKVSDKFIIEDLGSANGIKINGKYIKKAILYHNDEILIGEKTILHFLII